METNQYDVNGQGFGHYGADARRHAVRRAIETGERQVVSCNGQAIDAYERGATGLAKLVWTYGSGQPLR